MKCFIHNLEEKVVTVWDSLDDLPTKFDEIEERIREAEVLITTSKNTISSIVKLGWIVIGALITAGIGTLFMIN